MPRKAPAKPRGPVREETIPGSVKAGMTLADLERIPAFHGMDEDDAAAFLAHMSERRATAGEPIFREGEVGDGLFIIVDGSVSITRRNAKGGERELAVLTKDEVFGEMNLISDRPRTSGVRGKSDCRLLFFPRSEFQSLLRKGNRGATVLLLYFARVLAGRLDANNRKMMEVLDAAQRPASTEFSDFKRRLLKEWTF